MIQVNFYTTFEPPEKVGKNETYTPVFNTVCVFYGTNSIIKPSILIDYDSRIYNANYCYIPTFNRYYYIDNVNITDGQKMLVTLSVDVLTPRANVNNCECIVSRWAGGSTDIHDNKIPVTESTFIQGITFNNEPFTFTGNNYLLGVNSV